MFDWGFNPSKLKPQLKMAVHRFQMASNKKSALLKQSMREVAVLLNEDPPKEEKARIKAEALIRDDYIIEAYDILSLNCELLAERIKLIQHSKDCPPDLVSCISTLIYAAPRVDIPELTVIRKQFKAKYGKQFEENAMNNAGGILNERVVTKLSVEPPAAFLVQTYLEQICEKFEVDWSPTYRLTAEQMGEPMRPPVGESVPIGRGTGLGKTFSAHTGMTVTGDDDITYGGNVTLPPAQAPMVSVEPIVPPATGNDDFAEPDIYIPAAPGSVAASQSSQKQQQSSVAPSFPPPNNSSQTTNANGDRSDDDRDDDNEAGSGAPSNAPSGGRGSASYNDLAARFETLKNL
ncbi:regulator of Vps4 activity family protein [Nitzschia inconspicua]|uniref:Regulator of Vps4 activity family protein n=1 Tax=Nitzschia inconspicua TaxID=303405 RepID=A0A9K3LFC4_9STRA|nr:regulator of Vps4 activity family protein [Nitzschia inconspicua]